jgi:Fic family protein
MPIYNQFSKNVSVFQGIRLPEPDVLLVGYSAIIRELSLNIPLPDMLAAISHKHVKYEKEQWRMFPPSYTPEDSLYGHLVFAMKYEGINLAVLKALFDKISQDDFLQMIQIKVSGSYSRRLWFLYEWLLNTELALPDVKTGNYVDVLDSDLQYPGPVRISKRQRVRNNLPGVPNFCPNIRRTIYLDEFIAMNLNKKAYEAIGKIHPDLLIRAAGFLLLKDSKASFAIEGETPPQSRAERWGKAIGQAGTQELSEDEFLRLQEIMIGDFRFTHFGYRVLGGFIGEHERSSGSPIPNHISARAQDLEKLMNGLIETNKLLTSNHFDAVLAAALIAFGFVFIHPFEDGNGRMHRYLIHHVLAEKQYAPAQIVFPISAVILDHIQEYRKVLESYSFPRLKYIQWHPTTDGNVEVLNDTIDLYRYFDATKQAEFLYRCIKETVEKSLPEEVDYLIKYDDMKHFIKNYIEMPDKMIDLLIRFLRQEKGKFSERAKRKEFNALTAAEISAIEKKYAEIFLFDVCQK